jgi:PilZ domain
MPQEILSAEPESGTDVADLREFARHACTHKPLVRVLAKPSFVCLQARVSDVSTTGIALIYHRRLKPGTDLAIQLEHEQPELCRILVAKVVHAIPLARGKWRMGCKFNGWLTDDELTALLT